MQYYPQNHIFTNIANCLGFVPIPYPLYKLNLYGISPQFPYSFP